MIKIILALLILSLIFLYVDRKTEISSEKSLNYIYFSVNLTIFLLVGLLYTSIFNNHLDLYDYFKNIKLLYLIVVFLLTCLFLFMELYKSKSIKNIFVFLIIIGLTSAMIYFIDLHVFIFPFLINYLISKKIVDLLYSTIKINYLIANKRYGLEGYDTLIWKDPINKYFYKGDFFKQEILNKILGYFTGNYSNLFTRKNIILASDNLSDNINLKKIRDEYLTQGFDQRWVYFSSIKVAQLNKYKDNDIFPMGKSQEIGEEKFLVDYLGENLITYPRLDKTYKLYLVELQIFKIGEDFSLYDFNRVEKEKLEIYKEICLPMVMDKEEELVSKYLHKLIKKDIIYTEIIDYFYEENDNSYRITKNKNFNLFYNQGRRVIGVYSEELGLIGHLDRELSRELLNINKPISDNITLNFIGREKDFHNYEITSKDSKFKYPLKLSYDIEVDFSKLEKINKPSLNLYVRILLKLNS